MPGHPGSLVTDENRDRLVPQNNFLSTTKFRNLRRHTLSPFYTVWFHGRFPQNEFGFSYKTRSPSVDIMNDRRLTKPVALPVAWCLDTVVNLLSPYSDMFKRAISGFVS